uniref:SpoIID/LytB domain-containing protein n=1 Tax=Enterocloster clostridioformis TaxID=1531 RepID=UPI003FA41683
MTSAQYLELYKAQAVVARTYADYIVTHYNKHGQKGILCSTTDFQAFDPTSVKNRTLSWEFGFLVHYNKLLYHPFHKMFRILFCQKNVIDSSTYRI